MRRPENRENRVGIPDGIAGPSSVGVYRHIGRSTGRGSGHRQAAVGKDGLGRGDTNTVASYLPTAVTFLYDQNGNLRTNGSRVFQYDDENQLVCITEPGAWMSTNIYDGKLRRRIRKEYAWQNSDWVLSTEVRYVYDGNLVIQERDSFNIPKVTYTRGPDLSGTLDGAGGIGGLLARSDGSTMSLTHAYYHPDGNGNVTALADSNQRVVARYLYDPFGNTISACGPLASANLYRFSGKEVHPNSGLVYYLYRFYDPNLQRWPNRDPLGEEGGINLYALVVNDPIDILDAWGLDPLSCEDVGDIIKNNNLSGLDDAIIKCIAYRESGFDPKAKNPRSSATGLMQMTKAACKEAGCDFAKMPDPAEAIRCGSKYVGIRVKRANGNVTRGLNGYGTGPGYGKAIQDCANCIKNNKLGPKDAKGNPTNDPCAKDCLKKAKG